MLWIAGLVGFLLLASAFVVNATRPTYTCTDQFNPTAAPSVAPPTEAPATTSLTATPAGGSPAGGSPAPTAAPVTPPPPGIVQPDQGAIHVDAGSTVRYPLCPPASGRHYNGVNVGPIRGQFYGLNDQAPPPGWVHNLEHGAIVLLYSCRTPDGTGTAEPCTDAGQQAMRDLYARWPDSPYCNLPPGALTPVIARFDEMAWPYAAIVWDVVLPLQTLDEAAIFEFYAQRGERYNPEPQCADPTPTPGPATPTPAVTAAPSGAASPVTSPAASPGASPAASPASPAASPATTSAASPS